MLNIGDIPVTELFAGTLGVSQPPLETKRFIPDRADISTWNLKQKRRSKHGELF